MGQPVNKPMSYETAPETISIAETALSEWKRFKGHRSKDQAFKALMKMHMQHVKGIVAQGDIPLAAGSMFVTDIPGYDLSLVDANFPHLRQRRVSLFTRKGVETIIHLLQAGSGQTVQ